LAASNFISNAVTYTKYAPLPLKFHFPCQNLILAQATDMLEENKNGEK